MRQLDNKTTMKFWRLFVNKRLSNLLTDQFEHLTNASILEFVDLLNAMGIQGLNAVLVAIGAKDILPHQRTKLENIFDVDHLAREKGICQLSDLKEKKRQIETQPLASPTIENYRRQQFKLEEVHEQIIKIQMKLDSLGKRNSIPHDLYAYPTQTELLEKGLIREVPGNPYMHLTEKGETIIENAEKLAAMLRTDLQKEPSRETIRNCWDSLRMQLDSANPRPITDRVTDA